MEQPITHLSSNLYMWFFWIFAPFCYQKKEVEKITKPCRACSGLGHLFWHVTSPWPRESFRRGKFWGTPQVALIQVSFKSPVKLSFAMSINKSQGQSPKVIGLYLQEPCFSHGQLYVGCLHVGSNNNLYICTPRKDTLQILSTQKPFKINFFLE